MSTAYPTFIHVLYDADYLYIGLNMLDAEPGNIKGRIMQRDGRFVPLNLVGLSPITSIEPTPRLD
ncbi:MAG: hypothetical protein F4049_12500 [Gemmatimonadetes bacterium]|nr:hypothetical protein [Gemmatimonadota bacterium]